MDIYNPGGWLTSQDFLKYWIAEARNQVTKMERLWSYGLWGAAQVSHCQNGAHKNQNERLVMRKIRKWLVILL